MSKTPNQPNHIYMIGYGTFITNRTFLLANEVHLCKLPHYRRIWLKTTIFPFILPDPNFSGIHALVFTVSKDKLPKLDQYEGVEEGLYTREKISVELVNNGECEAHIYLPTEKCIQEYDLSVEKDPNDLWKDEIRKNTKIIERFPELLQSL